MGSADDAWRRWGEIDPYFAVLTAPQFESRRLDSYKEEFFASGTVRVDAVVKAIQQHFPEAKFGRALDFGCGVGRLTIPFARHYSEAIGVDISPAMLQEARANAARVGVENIRFELSDDELRGLSGEFDLVHTYIVLQHIPVPRGLAYIDQMTKLLRPGGIASLHFTVDRQRGFLRDAGHWCRSKVPLFNGFVNVARGHRWSEPMMQMNEYPLLEVLKFVEANGIDTQLVSLDRQTTTLAVQLLGQKAS